jgi:hypothetical protein
MGGVGWEGWLGLWGIVCFVIFIGSRDGGWVDGFRVTSLFDLRFI